MRKCIVMTVCAQAQHAEWVSASHRSCSKLSSEFDVCCVLPCAAISAIWKTLLLQLALTILHYAPILFASKPAQLQHLCYKTASRINYALSDSSRVRLPTVGSEESVPTSHFTHACCEAVLACDARLSRASATPHHPLALLTCPGR